nr:hypothetical protein CFP56_13190 [Quercus suber]
MIPRQKQYFAHRGKPMLHCYVVRDAEPHNLNGPISRRAVLAWHAYSIHVPGRAGWTCITVLFVYAKVAGPKDGQSCNIMAVDSTAEVPRSYLCRSRSHACFEDTGVRLSTLTRLVNLLHRVICILPEEGTNQCLLAE